MPISAAAIAKGILSLRSSSTCVSTKAWGQSPRPGRGKAAGRDKDAEEHQNFCFAGRRVAFHTFQLCDRCRIAKCMNAHTAPWSQPDRFCYLGRTASGPHHYRGIISTWLSVLAPLRQFGRTIAGDFAPSDSSCGTTSQMSPLIGLASAPRSTSHKDLRILVRIDLIPQSASGKRLSHWFGWPQNDPAHFIIV